MSIYVLNAWNITAREPYRAISVQFGGNPECVTLTKAEAGGYRMEVGPLPDDAVKLEHGFDARTKLPLPILYDNTDAYYEKAVYFGEDGDLVAYWRPGQCLLYLDARDLRNSNGAMISDPYYRSWMKWKRVDSFGDGP